MLRSISRSDPIKLFIIGILLFSGIMVLVSQYSIFLIIHNNKIVSNSPNVNIKVSYNKHNINTESPRVVCFHSLGIIFILYRF